MNEVELYMNQKGVEYRTIDKARAGRIYERLKAHITPPKRTIQVLGTNGKGSTGRFLALMLMQNGAKVLHFTSPHIFSFSERFYKNGAIIGDDELTNAHRFLQGFDFTRECSYFEYATFLAVALAQNVDYLILEAGVGGELDSTSVIPREMCIFSVIDYDHTEILGESIEEIATTKLNAVFYPNRVSKMILGVQKYEVVEKIAKEIAETNGVEFYSIKSNDSSLRENERSEFSLQSKQNKCASAHRISPDSWCKKSESKGAVVPPADFLLESDKRGTPPKSEKAAAFWRVGGAGRGVQPFLRKETSESNGKKVDCFGDESPRNDELESYLTKHRLADFLKPNLNLALTALEILGLKCDFKTLPKLDLRGRFEHIAPNIIIDVGHNQNAAFAIKQNLGQKKVILVYNSYFQKNISEILGILKDNILRVEILRVADNPRIIEQKTLERTLDSLGIAYQNFSGVDSMDSQNDYLVFGSFSVVEAFMREFMSKANRQ